MFYPFQEAHVVGYLWRTHSSSDLVCSRGEQTFYVLNAELLDEGWGEYARGKGTTEDIIKFLVETSDTHILEFKVGRDDRVRSGSDKKMRSTVGVTSTTYLLALALIFIGLPPSFMMVMSVFCITTPISICL